MASLFKLQSWIQQALTDKDKKKILEDGSFGIAKCTHIVVCHMQGSVPKEIHSVQLDGRQTAKELANFLYNKAELYCTDLPGRQQCCLQAIYEDSDGPQATMPFGMDGNYGTPGENGGGLMTEPPTTNGQLQQAMRHMELSIQSTHAKDQYLFSAMMQFNKQVMEHNSFLESRVQTLTMENAEAVNIIRTAIMEKATDDHEMKMKEQSFARATIERKKWMEMAPMLVNTILGREVFPHGNADTVLLEQVVANIDPSEIMKVASAFGGKAELMGPLMSRFLDIKADLEKRQKQTDDAIALASRGGDGLPELSK